MTTTVERHHTAPTRHLTVGETSFAYRRFGGPGPVPLVLLIHFRGNLDSWDPALVDGLAVGREVILVDYPGVGGSTGWTARTVEESAHDVTAFLDALGVRRADVLGFSLGGFVAQEIALTRPGLVRRLVLAGTGPKGGPGMHHWTPGTLAHSHTDEPGAEDVLYLFFSPSEDGRRLGGEFLGRMSARVEDRDPDAALAVRDVQYEAISTWGIPDHAALQRLTGIRSPTLIVQGDDDRMIPTAASHLMAGLIPGARIEIVPDAGHGSIFQHPDRTSALVGAFLDGADDGP